MPPPNLAGDAPILDVLHPVEVHLRPAAREELDGAVLHGLDGGFGERRHLHEPLRAEPRLNRGVAPVAVADVVLVLVNLAEDGLTADALLLKVDNQLAAAVEAVEALVGLRHIRHVRVIGHHVDELEAVLAAELKVRRVVGRRDLHRPGAEFPVHHVIGDDRQAPPDERQDCMAADQVTVPLVLGVHGDGGIAEHGLRARGGDFDIRSGLGVLGSGFPALALSPEP